MNFGFNDTNWRQWPLAASAGGARLQDDWRHTSSQPRRRFWSSRFLTRKACLPSRRFPVRASCRSKAWHPVPRQLPVRQSPRAARPLVPAAGLPGPNPTSPAPQGLPGFPDFGPGGLPDATPKANGGGIEPLTPLSPPKDRRPCREAAGWNSRLPTPATPARTTAKGFRQRLVRRRYRRTVSGLRRHLPANPTEPSPAKPIKGISLSRRSQRRGRGKSDDDPQRFANAGQLECIA